MCVSVAFTCLKAFEREYPQCAHDIPTPGRRIDQILSLGAALYRAREAFRGVIEGEALMWGVCVWGGGGWGGG